MRKFYCFDREEKKSMRASIDEAFPFLLENGHVVSYVGAGGKTTLLFAAAEHAAFAGRKVLVTTTTHIAFPDDRTVYAGTKEEVLACWAKKRYAVIGTPEKTGTITKLTMPENAFLQECMSLADLVLIEADGAKHHPCKVPAAHEPVILPESDIVVGVAGMRALDRTVDTAGFRLSDMAPFLQESRKAAGKSESISQILKSLFTESDLTAILSSEHGTKKGVQTGKKRVYYVCMNQCDCDTIKKRCDRMAAGLASHGNDKIIVTGDPSCRKNR